MFSFRLGKYHTARLWHPTVSVCLTLSKVGELFSRVAGLFCIPTSSGRELELLLILASTWPCQLQFLWKYWQPCYLARKPRQQGCATYLLCLLTKYLDQDLTSEPWTVQIRFSLMFSLNPIPLPPPTSMAFGKANSLGNMGTETRNPTVTGESRQAWSSLKNLYFPQRLSLLDELAACCKAPSQDLSLFGPNQSCVQSSFPKTSMENNWLQLFNVTGARGSMSSLS